MPIIRYLEKRLGPYREIPPLSEDPALTVNQLGKGTVIYVSGDLGNTIANYHMRDSLVIVENVAAKLAPGLERRLKAEVSGEVAFDRFTRGRLPEHQP